MTMINPYATLAQVKQRIGASWTEAAQDADLELVIQGASRRIDTITGRTFYKSAADETRYYTPTLSCRIYTDDIVSVTSIETGADGVYSETWDTGDYILSPSHGGTLPYSWIEVVPWSARAFTCGGRNSVKVTGIFGWAAVPDEIREAAILLSSRLWARRNSPFGVLGAGEFGQPIAISKTDPDIDGLLSGYTRWI